MKIRPEILEAVYLASHPAASGRSVNSAQHRMAMWAIERLVAHWEADQGQTHGDAIQAFVDWLEGRSRD